MTVLASIPTEQDHEVFVFSNAPLVPFFKRDQMEKAKYLQWLIDNVNADPQIRENVIEREHPQTGQLEMMYPLSHLIRIAGQYPDINAAKCAMGKLKTWCVPQGHTQGHTSSDPDQVQNFETLLASITIISNNNQRWIMIPDFFKYIFPRLRPNQQGFLPCIYRSHLNLNGELVKFSVSVDRRILIGSKVAAGSSIAMNLVQRNYQNILNTNNPQLQKHLENELREVETTLASSGSDPERICRTIVP